MKIMLTPKCHFCGNRYPITNKTDIPVMIGFELNNGETLNICMECLIKMGKEQKNG